MNTETRKTINELFELCDKYIEQGKKDEARECLNKINEINSEIFAQTKRDFPEVFDDSCSSAKDS